MIKDKNSAGYKLAEELAAKYMSEGKDATQALFEKRRTEMKFKMWEGLAIIDTFQTLVGIR